jgi:hypothetical protein
MNKLGDSFRLAVNISIEASEKLKTIAKCRKLSLSDTVRQSLELYFVVNRELAKGSTIMIGDSLGNYKTIVLSSE